VHTPIVWQFQRLNDPQDEFCYWQQSHFPMVLLISLGFQKSNVESSGPIANYTIH
jgi:hypothetical protein